MVRPPFKDKHISTTTPKGDRSHLLWNVQISENDHSLSMVYKIEEEGKHASFYHGLSFRILLLETGSIETKLYEWVCIVKET